MKNKYLEMEIMNFSMEEMKTMERDDDRNK
jgi:hypothetical protein